MTNTRRMTAGRWVLHGALMLLFLFAGWGKLVMTPEQMAGPVNFPVWFLRFIGVCEILGGLGLLLPIATGIKPVLTRLATFGLVIIMTGATATTLIGEPKSLAALPFVVLCLVVYAARLQQRTGVVGTAGRQDARPA